MCKTKQILTGLLALLLALGAGALTLSRLKLGPVSWSLAPKAAARAGETLSYSTAEGRVSANEADAEELCTVKGIGPKLAAAIIGEREQNGAFRYWEDLLCVRGIGESTCGSWRASAGSPLRQRSKQEMEKTRMYQRYGKRCLDVILSLIALIVLSPLFLLIALAIRLDSPGGVIFSQKRVGMHKKLFSIYKFRTMRSDTAPRRAHQRFGGLYQLYYAGGAFPAYDQSGRAAPTVEYPQGRNVPDRPTTRPVESV